ncbi:hypothetical protein ACFX13_042212 [Malus domestica]
MPHKERQANYETATTASGVAATTAALGGEEVLGFASLVGAEVGGEGLRWGCVLCFNFKSIYLILESLVGLLGFGPQTTRMDGFFSVSFFIFFFSTAGTSLGMRFAIAFQ